MKSFFISLVSLWGLIAMGCGGSGQGTNTVTDKPMVENPVTEAPSHAEPKSNFKKQAESQIIEPEENNADTQPVRPTPEETLAAQVVSEDSEDTTPLDVEEPVTIEYKHAEVVLQEGHRGRIVHITISDDNRFILTASKDDTVKMLSRDSGLLIRTFHANSKKINGKPSGYPKLAAFVPGNKLILAIAGTKMIVWEMDTGKKVQEKELGTNAPTQVAFFSDGRQAVFGYGETRFEIWDLKKGISLKNIDTGLQDKGKRPMVLSQNEAKLLCGHSDEKVRVWDLNSGTLQTTHAHLHTRPITTLMYTEDKNLASWNDSAYGAGSAGDIVIWNSETGEEISRIPRTSGHYRWVLLPGSNRAIGLTANSYLDYIDLKNKKPLRQFVTKTDSGAPFAVASDGSFVVSADSKYNISIWGIRPDFEIPKKDNAHRITTPDKTFHGSEGGMFLAASSKSFRAAFLLGREGNYLWDLSRGFMEKRVKRQYNQKTLVLSPDGRFLATGDNIWDAKHHKDAGYLLIPGHHRKYSNAVSFSPNGRHVTLAVKPFGLATWDISSSKGLKKTIAYQDSLISGINGRQFETVQYSPSGKQILLGGPTTILVNAADYRVLHIFDLETTKVAFLPTGNHVLLSSKSSAPMLYAVDGVRSIHTFSIKGSTIVDWTLSTDGTRLVTLSSKDGPTNVLTIWNVSSRKKIHSYHKPNFDLTHVAYLHGTDHVVTLDAKSAPRVWNLENGRTAALMAKGDEWAICTEDGYFDASRKGGHLLAVVQGHNGYRVDQLSVKYNRPDAVLRDLGLGTPDLIAHYYEMYRKRLRKMGVDEDNIDLAFAMAPKATIEKVEHKAKWVRVTVNMTAGQSPLSKYNLYANDVPIYGMAGQPIDGHKKKVQMILELTEGINNLEVSATNKMGIESLRDKYTTTYFGQKDQKHDLYYLAFGVSKYQDPSLNLKYAHKDARELEAVFREVYQGYNQVHSRVYTDEKVTVETIDEARKFLSNAKVDDTVVLFVAGHGLYDPDNEEDYYFVVHDTDLDNLRHTGIHFSLIENLLSDMEARRKLFLLDTCQSGELEEGMETQILAAAQSRGLIHRGIRRKKLGKFSKTKSFKKYLAERDQRFIYNDVTRRSGAMVISSSRGSEFSFEKDELENGVFTEEVYNAFTSPAADRNNDKSLSIDELRDYVFKAVTEHTEGLQHPVVDRDNLELHFEFPLIKTAKPK